MPNWKENKYVQKLTQLGKFLVFAVIVLGFIGCNYLYYIYIRTVTTTVQSYNITGDENVISYTSAGENVVEQVMLPQYSVVKSIIIRVKTEESKVDEDGYLTFSLLQDDDVLVQEDVPSAELAKDVYYVFSIDKKLSKKENYTIRILLENGSDAHAIGLTQAHVGENVEKCKVGGGVCSKEIEVDYIYELMDKTLLRNWIIKDILFVLALVVAYFLLKLIKRNENIYKALCVTFWLLLPLLMYVMVEYVTGNLYTIERASLYKNIVIYYVLYFALSLIFKKLSSLTLVYSGVLLILALVQYFVTMFRGRPFMLMDIVSAKTAATVASTYYFEIDAIMFYVLLLGIAILSCSQFMNEKFLKKRYYVRIAGLVLSLAGLCGMNAKGEKFLPSINMWDLNLSYQNHGLVLTLIGQVPYMVAKAPENYSCDTVAVIAGDYVGEENKNEHPQNIILIMNESFSDLEYIADIQTETELLPFWKSLEENTVKGHLSVPVFGAGTSNSEYEVLTGNSMEFVISGSVPYQANVQAGENSMVSILEAQGYGSIALHPYPAENWNRNNAYNHMGFDEFISMENWGEYELIRWCPSDRTAYDKLIEVYEGSEENLFAFLVTMQNHGGYATDYENFVVDVEVNYNADYPQAARYLSLLQESDRAYQELIEYFSQVDERTMIIMFGDHQAAIEDEFYEELFGKSLGELSFEENQLRYITPFMIWTNYDIEESEDVMMSANFFGSYILSLAGAELPAYNQFLLHMMEEIPVIGVGGICDNHGNWYDWNNLPERYQEWINKYQILQYNNIYDRSNREDGVFRVAVE